MRKFSIGAVSISALLFATAACGNSNDAYQSADADRADENAESTDADKTANESQYDADEYAVNEPSSSHYGDPATDATTAAIADDPLSTTPAYQTAETPAAKTRAEIEMLAMTKFESADADKDGVIDREEYVQLALSSARDFERFIDEPAKLMSVNPVTDPEDATMPDETAATDPTETETMGDAPVDQTSSTVQTAETETPLDPVETADIEIAASATFDDAAGDDDTMTAEELRTAFLARFDEADVDGDEQLDDAELRTFAALTRGQEGPATADSDTEN